MIMCFILTYMSNILYPTLSIRLNIVTAILWDKFQIEFLTKYNELQGAKPVIVIIKHGKIKEPQGKNYIGKNRMFILLVCDLF
jgi:hypothetical protein